MPAAARVKDKTGHPGVIAGPGVPSVIIAGEPAAAAGDLHVCNIAPNAGPHPTTSFARGSASVRLGGREALRVGDAAGCGSPIVAGATSVRIG